VTYLAPQTIDQALASLASGSVSVVAGGTDYFPALQKGREAENLVDISQVSGLRGITQSEHGWRIGAATTWTDIVKTPLPSVFDSLKAAAKEVGSVQIQNTGTIGGNLCNASPAADGVPPLLTLDAQVEITGPSGVRTLPLDQFITGVRKTDLGAGELLTAIHIPAQPDHLVSAFEKLGSRRYLVISITMTSVVLGVSDGLITDARIAIGACSAVAQRQSSLEKSLIGMPVSGVAIVPEMLQNLAPIEDVRGDATYRLIAAAEQCQRAIRRLAGS
jgi:CO/xanthine dehydrogenase FAD-binding subunit